MKTVIKTIKTEFAGKLIVCGIVLLMLSAVNAIGKTVTDEPDYMVWVKEFVQLRLVDKDTAIPLMKIKDYYVGLTEAGKDSVNGEMVNMISGYLSENRTDETMAMIDLYDFLAKRDDAKLADFYFIKGNIYAERKDSVMLKETIAQLDKCNGMKEYGDKLNDYLLQIRNLQSVKKGLEGRWVSDKLMSGLLYGCKIFKYQIYIASEANNTNMIIASDCPFVTDECIVTRGVFKFPYPQFSQLLFPLSKDSLYVAWSSEKLKNYDPYMVGLLRQTTAITGSTVAGHFSQRHKFSTGETMAAGMAAGLVEVGLNSLFDAMFTPTKKMYVLEGRLKRVNDYVLEGEMTYKESKVKAGEENNARLSEKKEKITLLKWTDESGIIFMRYNGRPETPFQVSNYPVEKQKKKVEKARKRLEKKRAKALAKKTADAAASEYTQNLDTTIYPYWKDIRDNADTEYGKAYLEFKKSKSKNEFIKEHNSKQMEKLRRYNMQLANKQ